MEISKQIKLARIKANINQIQLPIQMDWNRQTVSNWETGATLPDVNTLKQLSKLLTTKFIIKWSI